MAAGLQDLGLGNRFSRYDLKSMNKISKNRLDFIIVKNFYAAKDTEKKVKKQSTE